jgi:hypothetical protein
VVVVVAEPAAQTLAQAVVVLVAEVQTLTVVILPAELVSIVISPPELGLVTMVGLRVDLLGLIIHPLAVAVRGPLGATF